MRELYGQVKQSEQRFVVDSEEAPGGDRLFRVAEDARSQCESNRVAATRQQLRADCRSVRYEEFGRIVINLETH